jgi:anti-sigma regulatory factor (Ser/Thr protein kinase)
MTLGGLIVRIAATCLDVSLPATTASVGRARRSVGEAAVEAGASGAVLDDIKLCVSEAVANAALHAYGDEPGSVHVVVELAGLDLVVVVSDNGTGIVYGGGRSGGGRGLGIISKLARRHSVMSARGGGTEVRMTFRLDRPSVQSAAR